MAATGSRCLGCSVGKAEVDMRGVDCAAFWGETGKVGISDYPEGSQNNMLKLSSR